MTPKRWTQVILVVCIVIALSYVVFVNSNCSSSDTASGGPSKVNVTVKTGSDGLTMEQRNIKSRLEAENKPGNVQHLYIISAYSGEVIMYSSVKGKVTSSSKRLQPYNTSGGLDSDSWSSIEVDVRGNKIDTNEIMQDDGTYGDSVPYLYWWDMNGAYHQQYIQGGMILHISDKPLRVGEVSINLDEVK